MAWRPVPDLAQPRHTLPGEPRRLAAPNRWHSPSWLERGSMKVDCFRGPSSRALWWGPLPGGSLSGCGTGRWQNFPVELAGHQHSSRPMQRPPFRQGIWQKSTTTLRVIGSGPPVGDKQAGRWGTKSGGGRLEDVEPLEMQCLPLKPLE